MMDGRKRPRRDDDDGLANSTALVTASTASASAGSSPTLKLLQTEIRTLRAELQHSQSIRSIERKSATRSESRLKRQLADAYEEINQNTELIESLREEIDLHGQKMEESRLEWMERIQWYEEQFEASQQNKIMGEEDEEDEVREKSFMLQRRLDATLDQVKELERLFKGAEEKAARAEQRALDAEETAKKSVEERPAKENDEENEASKEMLRAQRIKIADTERANRELQRQNADLKQRNREMVQLRNRNETSERRIGQLETEVNTLTRLVEEGKEAQHGWMVFRKEIVEEGLVDEGSNTLPESGSIQPPEIATVVRKFQTLKRKTQQLEDENGRITQLSEAHLRRCAMLENQVSEKSETIAFLEKQQKEDKEAISDLELENRKIVAQQKIWQRESEGMRSLLETYEQVESKSPNFARNSKPGDKMDVDESSPTVQGLTISLNSARDEVKLLTERNKMLEAQLEALKNEQLEAKTEHERVLEKFHKLRNALMEERAKAEAAEARACQAETLAGKGSYNSETTQVLHMKSNPLADAIRLKYQTEIDSLKRKLEEVEEALASKQNTLASGAGTPSTSSERSSIGSGKKDDALTSLDAQKLHKRLKERFKEQIGLFREGVYLITGFKIDMSFSDSDCPRFKVRSIYGEREEDNLMFQWPRNKSKDQLESSPSNLDLMTTDMARLLMNGPSAIYMTKFDSVPAFMASVTLGLFEKQTMI